MKIQINTDAHISGKEALAEHMSGIIEDALEHVSEHITRVEVHLSDENGTKSGHQDKRCMLEARIEGRSPLAVTEQAATLEQSVQGAAGKLARLLESRIGRGHERRAGSPRSRARPSPPPNAA
ncbi:HPF/RaiA family ribosome-associated protein [Pseudomarimonas salicorniae]|uniref:HPF/RaiA family ribosome-associated protein n=1 Tax=Pseudomarimonas salicorniae TaxID=2933270 RepID=A0ABT0GGF8_9GAMM|nr:HPF/RaiA family ribosome-associated protein [Lysobacter sp. CAU 1642]MCK7593100.1 HPF/RaiA family ribosome-associated protein [Lysobacter sp. CAU 1642]